MSDQQIAYCDWAEMTREEKVEYPGVPLNWGCSLVRAIRMLGGVDEAAKKLEVTPQIIRKVLKLSYMRKKLAKKTAKLTDMNWKDLV